MRREAIIFDLDGTAIDSPDHQLPTPHLVEAIRVAKESFYMCAATGRVWSFAKPVLKALRVTDPCIVSAGTQIYDPVKEAPLWQCNIEPKSLEAITQVIHRYPDYKVLYNDYDTDTYFHGQSMPIELDKMPVVHFLGLLFVPQSKATQVIAELSKVQGITCTLALAQ